MYKQLLLIFSLFILSACGTATAPSPTNNIPSSSTTMNSPQENQVKTSEVNYFQTTKGFLAEPKQPGSYPGIVMIHEWWGLNEHIKAKAEELAAQGYLVLAVDLYNGEIANTPDQARELTGKINQTIALENLRAAADYLRKLNTPKIASLGWCFGGGQSLKLALSGEKLDATVIYYGQLETDSAKLSAIKWPVLGVFGEQDSSIPLEQVQQFEKGLKSNNTPQQIYLYPNVGHAFANPSNKNYAPAETTDAWNKTLEFLNNSLK